MGQVLLSVSSPEKAHTFMMKLFSLLKKKNSIFSIDSR